MARTPPDQDRVAEAIRLYQSGLSRRAVASRMGIGQATVSRWLGEQMRRTGRPSDVSDERLWRLRYEERMTYDQIAAATGARSRTPLRRRLAAMERYAFQCAECGADRGTPCEPGCICGCQPLPAPEPFDHFAAYGYEPLPEKGITTT